MSVHNVFTHVANQMLSSLLAILPALYYVLPKGLINMESTPQVQTFRKLLKAYSTLRPSSLVALTSPDFIHTVLPASLQIPSRTGESFQQHATQIFSLFADFQMIPQGSVHYSPETNVVTAHCKMGGKLNAESEHGKKLIHSGLNEWWTECMLMVKMDENGQKVVEIKEFVNSSKAEEMKKRIMGLLES